MKVEKEYSLLDFEFANSRKKLKVVLTYFNGLPKIDIREYYWDDNDETFKHSKRGIQLDSQKAEALRLALQHNATIIDKHMLTEDLEKWATSIKKIESSSDFYSNFEFFKTHSTGDTERISFNPTHPFGKQISLLESSIVGNSQAEQLLDLLKLILITHNHSINQYDDSAKIVLGDFINDHMQTWSTLLKRLLKSNHNK